MSGHAGQSFVILKIGFIEVPYDKEKFPFDRGNLAFENKVRILYTVNCPKS